MPELPEVETIVRGLRTHFLDHHITAVRMTGHPMFEEDPTRFCRRLSDRHIRGIDRHGKSIFVSLDDLDLRIHLGMTGQLLVKNSRDPMESHTHLVFEFQGTDKQLRYRDIRRFGEMEIVEPGDDKRSVPDAWKISEPELLTSIQKIKGYLKHGLLGQKFIVGLGNIYVDEALYLAKLHPKKKGENVRPDQWKALASAIRTVLRNSIDLGGTSFSNYVDVYGSRGGFKGRLSVYGKAGSPCPICGTKIKKIVFAGRGTHFCPQCQRQPK